MDLKKFQAELHLQGKSREISNSDFMKFYMILMKFLYTYMLHK